MDTQFGAFRERLTQVVEIFDATGSLPSRSSATASERSLAQWFATTKSKYQRRKLSTAYADVFEELIDDAMLDGAARRWGANLDSFAAFTAAAGHLPNRDSDDSEERRLASWLGHQRSRFRANTMTAPQLDALDAAAPDWEAGHDQRWQEQSRALHKHMNEHAAPPASESPLGRWLHRQRRLAARGQLQQPRASELKRIEERITSCTSNSSTPATATPSLPPASPASLQDLSPMASSARETRGTASPQPSFGSSELQPSRCSQPCSSPQCTRCTFSPSAPSSVSSPRKSSQRQILPSDDWLEGFTKLTQLGRQPKARADDPQERAIAGWLRQQRQLPFRSIHSDLLDCALPGWRGTSTSQETTQPRWTYGLRVLQLCVFTRTFQRSPSRSSDLPAERSLAIWVGRNSYGPRKNRSTR